MRPMIIDDTEYGSEYGTEYGTEYSSGLRTSTRGWSVVRHL